MSFWKLHPFELPDDIRLRSGELYRLLWVDAAGMLVRPLGNQHLPALRFFLGPADDAHMANSAAQSSGRSRGRRRRPEPVNSNPAGEPVTLNAMADVPPADRVESEGTTRSSVADPAGHDAAVSEQYEVLTAAVKPLAADPASPGSTLDQQPQPPTTPEKADAALSSPTVVPSEAAPVLSPAQVAHAAAAALASSHAEPPTPTTAVDELTLPSTPINQRSADASPSGPKVSVQLGQKTLNVTEATWAAVKAPLDAAQSGTNCIPICTPPLTQLEVKDLTGIILHTEMCAAFVYELESFHARVFAKPAPPAPEFNLHPDELARIRTLAGDPRLGRAALDLQRAWLGCHKQGSDAMYRLPPPFVSLTDVEAGRITSILNSPARRAYAVYAAARIEALQTGSPQPSPPETDLTPKVRRQIRRLFSDARLQVLMQHGLWLREAQSAKESASGEPGVTDSPSTTGSSGK